jgi:uncharacterized membrane protein YphA (DoxX/SURF4 family)
MASRTWSPQTIQATGRERHLLLPRLVAGLPLLAIGLMHVFDDTAPMRPLVEAARLPAAGILSPLAVAAEIVAGLLLLAGFYTRVGALVAIPVMAVAAYAHLVIDTWPNAAGEPPLLLPLAVFASAAYVLRRGGGSWSLDGLVMRRRP